MPKVAFCLDARTQVELLEASQGMRTNRRTLLGLLACGMLLPGAARSAAVPLLDLSAYKGRVVYLDFWASWCAPCRLSFPWMNQIQTAFARQGLDVVAVNVDHDRDLAEEFLRRNLSQFKIVYDPAGAIPSSYNIKAMPTTILIGRDGKIRYVHSGFYENQENMYRSHITELLNEKAP
jgi:thiol-disulfide isomerase/thioredoxin